VFHANEVSPSEAIPRGVPIAATFTVRGQSFFTSTPGVWIARLTTWENNDPKGGWRDGTRVIDWWVDGTIAAVTQPCGWVDTFTVSPKNGADTSTDRYWYCDWLYIFAKTQPWTVTLSEFEFVSHGPGSQMFITDFLIEVDYLFDEPLPLLQRQRNDHLAP